MLLQLAPTAACVWLGARRGRGWSSQQGRCGWSLTVFHFCVCVSFPHPLKNLRKKGGGGANRPQKLAIRALVLRRPLPALPTWARREV